MDNTETIRDLIDKSMNNREAISNLTTIVQRLAQGMATADGYRPSPLLHYCEEIKNKWPDSSSDYYTIVDTNGRRRHVYCEMEQVCGSSGWMRVAYLNMTDPSEKCPRGLGCTIKMVLEHVADLPYHLVVASLVCSSQHTVYHTLRCVVE